MRALLLVLLLVVFPASAGELVAKHGDDEVRLFDSPCVHGGTLGQIPPAMRDQFHKATGRFGGQMFYGCWIHRGNAARSSVGRRRPRADSLGRTQASHGHLT